MEIFSFRYRDDDYEHPRRAFLVRALTLGLFAAGGPLLHSANALAMASQQRPLPAGRSIYRLTGEAWVNGMAADEHTLIRPGDTIRTSPGSELIFVVGKDAFILRESSEVLLALNGNGNPDNDDDTADRIVNGLRVLTGKLLSVFGERRPDEQPLSLHTTIATVGIRGTGIYLEAHRDRSYVCTCYGETRLQAVDDPASSEDISSQHHDAPRFILPAGPEGQRIEPAPVINHTDMELILIEELVGRVPPFTENGVDYGGGY